MSLFFDSGGAMLRFRTLTGSIEALPQQEARVRGLSDTALLRELNTSSEPDPFAVAEAIDRAIVVFSSRRGLQPAISQRH
jgi:hypothetical protein